MKKKIKEPSPVGRIVMVYPDLTTDPANMQGEIGRVTEIVSPGAVSVYFPKDKISAKYSTTALATMLPKNEILKKLQQHLGSLTYHEQKGILSVIRSMVERNQTESLNTAMYMQRIQGYCTVNLQMWQDIKESQILSKRKDRGLSPG